MVLHPPLIEPYLQIREGSHNSSWHSSIPSHYTLFSMQAFSKRCADDRKVWLLTNWLQQRRELREQGLQEFSTCSPAYPHVCYTAPPTQLFLYGLHSARLIIVLIGSSVAMTTTHLSMMVSRVCCQPASWPTFTSLSVQQQCQLAPTSGSVWD